MALPQPCRMRRDSASRSTSKQSAAGLFVYKAAVTMGNSAFARSRAGSRESDPYAGGDCDSARCGEPSDSDAGRRLRAALRLRHPSVPQRENLSAQGNFPGLRRVRAPKTPMRCEPERAVGESNVEEQPAQRINLHVQVVLS